MAYSKLHSSLVNSSLWTEADNVRILFITLLALCDREGYVYGSKPGLERLANIEPISNENDLVDPWHVLMSPDPNSSDRMRNPENEGRRIEEVSGGFRLLNFPYYRGLRNEDDRREQNRSAQARFKAREKVSQDKPESAKISLGQPRSAAGKPISEADTEADTEKKHPLPPQGGAGGRKKPTLEEAKAYGAEIAMAPTEVESWYDHFESNGWRVGGKTAMKDWKAAMRNGKRHAITAPNTKIIQRRPLEPVPTGEAYKPFSAEPIPELTDEQIAKNQEFIRNSVAQLKNQLSIPS